MCIAIYKPADKRVKHKHLRNSFCNNPHGAGIAYAHEGQVYIEKGFFDVDSLIEAYVQHQDKPCLIHFRWATSGETNQFNCHPWDVAGMAWIHNGVIDIPSSKEMSDTGHFLYEIIEPLLNRSPEMHNDPAFIRLVEMAIGNNKLLAMKPSGEVVMFNEHEGHWRKGVWYSNDTYKKTAFVTRSIGYGSWSQDDPEWGEYCGVGCGSSSYDNYDDFHDHFYYDAKSGMFMPRPETDPDRDPDFHDIPDDVWTLMETYGLSYKQATRAVEDDEYLMHLLQVDGSTEPEEFFGEAEFDLDREEVYAG